jgi:hypothetical protein
MSAPVSITAPCPAKMLRPTEGATSARVTPSARLTAMVVLSGLSAGATVDCGVERPVLRRVVGASGGVRRAPALVARGGEVDLGEAEPREAGDDSGRDPLSGRVDDLRVGGELEPHSARGDDPAVADHHGPIGDRLRPVAERNRAIDDRKALRADRR